MEFCLGLLFFGIKRKIRGVNHEFIVYFEYVFQSMVPRRLFNAQKKQSKIALLNFSKEI